MNIYTNQRVAQYIQGSIQLKRTVPMLFEFLDYVDEIGLIIEEPLLIKNFILELSQIQQLEQFIREKYSQRQSKQKSKAQIIIDMIKLILERNLINELNSVYVENEKLNYFFHKIGNDEGIKLLNQLASISVNWTQVKDNLYFTALLTQSVISDYLILESIEFDEVQLTVRLSKKLKKTLKSQKVKMLHYSYHLEQSNQSIIKFLLTNLSETEFKNTLLCEKKFGILCNILKKNEKFQILKKRFKNSIPLQIIDLDQKQDKIHNNSLNKLKLIYLNYICQKMIVYPEILKQLEINSGILNVRNSYYLFKSFEKDSRLNKINTQLQISIMLNHFTNDEKLAYFLQNFGQQYDLQYLNQEILLYTIISHLEEKQISVQLELTAILQDTGFQQFYSQLLQVSEGTASKLIAQCIFVITKVLKAPKTIIITKNEEKQNIQKPKQQSEVQNQMDNNLKIQYTKQNEQVKRILQYCILNKIAMPEIFKYFDYSSQQLTIKKFQQFEQEMKQFTFLNLDGLQIDTLCLLEQLVKMIELIQFNQGQIEQNRLKSFVLIIPELITYFEYFIQNAKADNVQDQNSDIDENKLDKNPQLADQAIRLLQKILKQSENLTWQEIKKKYLIQMLNYNAFLGQPLPQILGALDLVESELILKIDKSLIKLLKSQGQDENAKQYQHNYSEKELICKLLDQLTQEIKDPDIQKQLEVQLQSIQVRNLYANIKQLRLKEYSHYFKKMYRFLETKPLNKWNLLSHIYNKVKAVYLNYICSNEILAPELIKNITIRKKKQDTFRIAINLNNQLIEDFINNPSLKNLNDQCQISQILSKEVTLESAKILDQFKLSQMKSQVQQKLILDAIIMIHKHHQSIAKDLHLIFQKEFVIKTMSKLEEYSRSEINNDSQIRQVYRLLDQMNEFVNRQFQNEQKITETPEFYKKLTNYSVEETGLRLTVNKNKIEKKNIRKMLGFMVEKQVVFPEFIKYLHIKVKIKSYLLLLNKPIELVTFIENNTKSQQFMNNCLNRDQPFFHQIKLTDFEKLPVNEELDIKYSEAYEQTSIANILQILFQQKENHKESLRCIFQQSVVQCLIYQMKLIYTKIPRLPREIQQGYQILYDLNYWSQNDLEKEKQFV